MIKMVPHFATTDGLVHASLDGAVAHERRSMVTALLLSVRGGFGLALGQIDQTADVICGNGDELVKVLTADLKRGLHSGGIVHTPGNSHIGERLAETIRRPAPTVAKTTDADGAVLYIGDRVHLVKPEDADTAAKWGSQPTRQIGHIREDGTVTFAGDKDWVWHPTAIRKGDAPKAAA